MAGDTKKTSQLGIATTLANTDRVVVLTNPNSTAQTQTITVNNFISSMRYANSSAAGILKLGQNLTINATGHVSSFYPAYANVTVAGIVKVGNNASVNATGFINTRYPEYANVSVAGIVKVGNNLSVNATGFMNTPGTGSWTFDGTRANTGGSQNSWIDGQSPGGLWLHNDYTITLTTSANSANSTYGYGYFSNSESGLYNQLNTTNTWSWLGTNISDSEEPYVFIENTRNAGANNQITNRWIFDLHGNFSLPANSTVGSEGGFHIENATTISANSITIHNNIFDDLNRPLINVNALDINADGGTPATVFGPSDTVFDGGAGTTVFGLYEAALDGGVSFNNRHSATFIDGGGAANQF